MAPGHGQEEQRNPMTTGLAFEVTTEAPAVVRTGGRGRPRTNPFDEAVRTSYAEGWADAVSDDAPTGKWFKLTDPETTEELSITKEQATKYEAQVRSAASHLSETMGEDVGSNVRYDPKTGRFQFRGAPKHVTDKASTDTGSGESGTEDADTRENWAD